MTYLHQNVVIFIHDPIELKILILFISHHNHDGRECFLSFQGHNQKHQVWLIIV